MSILSLRPYHKGRKVDIEHKNNVEQFVSIQTINTNFYASEIFVSILSLRPYLKGHKVDIEHKNNAEQFASTQMINTNLLCQ